MSETAPELVHALQAEFTPAEWTGKCTARIRPLGNHVLVLCDEVAELTSGRAGAALLAEAGVAPQKARAGVAFSTDMAERLNLASEQGVITRMGAGAFAIHDDGRTWADYKPVPGDRVYFEKYAGRQARGKDGRIYRLMDYRSIAAVYESDTAFEED